MSNIQDLLAQILAARYGRDVRQSIHDAIETCYEDGHAGAIDLQAREDISALEADVTTLQNGKVTDLGQIVVPNTEDTILDALKNAFGQVYSSMTEGKQASFFMEWASHNAYMVNSFKTSGLAIFEATTSNAQYYGYYNSSNQSVVANEVQTKCDLGTIRVAQTYSTFADVFTNAFTQIKNNVKYERSYVMGIYWSGHAGFTCEFTVVASDALVFDITGATAKYIGSFVISSNTITLKEVPTTDNAIVTGSTVTARKVTKLSLDSSGQRLIVETADGVTHQVIFS